MKPKPCPECGHIPPGPIGRPRKLDDQKVKALRKEGLSLADIATRLGVTRAAIQAALKR